MKRKICILTHPLRNNYGGLLQAYALQKILRDFGHSVVTDRGGHEANSKIRWLFDLFLKLKIFNKLLPFTRSELLFISKNTREFVDKYMDSIDFTLPNKDNPIYSISKFDTYIVGSDQIWRSDYCSIYKYYLGFLDSCISVKRIAYAASFGKSDWTYSPKEEIEAKRFASLFDSISVREDTAINLCKTKLSINATLVLDPTLLLEKDVYIDLIEKDCIPKSSGDLMVYLLDKNPDKLLVIERVKRALILEPFEVMPEIELSKNNRLKIEKCVYPRVTEWLRGFMDAKFVVTDSFHGTVFSIIFNKPFIAISNEGRGSTRFTSLLKILGLEDRLIFSSDQLVDIQKYLNIDYGQVNDKKKKMVDKSMRFLINSLS